MAKGVSNRWIILGTLAFFAVVFVAWLLLRRPAESPALSGSDARASQYQDPLIAAPEAARGSSTAVH